MQSLKPNGCSRALPTENEQLLIGTSVLEEKDTSSFNISIIKESWRPSDVAIQLKPAARLDWFLALSRH